jgi:hypothetical protein
MNCRTCDAPDPKFMCGKCKCMKYCSQICQKNDHFEHKNICKKCDTSSLTLDIFKDLDKDQIFETGNGNGGGRVVREGVELLTAYAMALRLPRATLISVLSNAPGSIGQHWLDVMEEYEIEELSGTAASTTNTTSSTTSSSTAAASASGAATSGGGGEEEGSSAI